MTGIAVTMLLHMLTSGILYWVSVGPPYRAVHAQTHVGEGVEGSRADRHIGWLGDGRLLQEVSETTSGSTDGALLTQLAA